MRITTHPGCRGAPTRCFRYAKIIKKDANRNRRDSWFVARWLFLLSEDIKMMQLLLLACRHSHPSCAVQTKLCAGKWSKELEASRMCAARRSARYGLSCSLAKKRGVVADLRKKCYFCKVLCRPVSGLSELMSATLRQTLIQRLNQTLNQRIYQHSSKNRHITRIDIRS